MQKYFENFHKAIKVDSDKLREKRDIVANKICNSIKETCLPIPDVLNQGSYIYGVGVFPIDDEEYDIDVGLVFSIKSDDYEAMIVRKYVYDAIKYHTDKVENHGPCIRVKYEDGYHVDLVVYARFKNSESIENYQFASKDNKWIPAEPKKLKKIIQEARKSFSDTNDSSGSDQLQRVVRYLKRWNDLNNSEGIHEKPSGLAILLLVIKYLETPVLDSSGNADDLAALIQIAYAVKNTIGRIVINKPTQQFEDMYAKLSDLEMILFKSKFASLLKSLEKAAIQTENEACKTLKKQFGDDFPDSDQTTLVRDMNAEIPSFNNPSPPWTKL